MLVLEEKSMAQAAAKPKRTKKAAAAPVEAPTEVSIVAYKAFDPNLACRGHQYEVGKTYEMDGKAKLCERGFHACENPFDVHNYYPLGSRVARVTVAGAVDRRAAKGEDSKICGAKLTVDVELTLPEFIRAGVAWIIGAAKGNTATGDSGHAAATGDRGHAAATGDRGIAASLGMDGTATAQVGGAITIAYHEWNGSKGRYELKAIRSSMVGENGVEPGKAYKLNANGDFVEASA